MTETTKNILKTFLEMAKDKCLDQCYDFSNDATDVEFDDTTYLIFNDDVDVFEDLKKYMTYSEAFIITKDKLTAAALKKLSEEEKQLYDEACALTKE